MRKLTQQEIDQAPDWANFYSIQKEKPYFTEFKRDQIGLPHRPVPRKEFDISEHLESDSTHESRQPYISDEGCGTLKVDGNILKFHAIGIAKYFKLTAADLK